SILAFITLEQWLPSNNIYVYVCPAIESTYADTMADLNIPANGAPAEQAHAIAPPTRTDDQIFPSSNWFWDTMCFNSSTGLYSFQLDEQWFNLHKDILRDALDITPTNENNPFVAPPSSDTVIEYVNTLGYPRGATMSSKATKATKPKVPKATKPVSDPKPKPAQTQPPKTVLEKKRKLVQETPDKPSPAKRSKGGRVKKYASLGTKKRKREASEPAESPSLDAELALIDSETEFDDEVPKIHTGDQDEGQAGPNPSKEEPGKTNAKVEVQLMVSVPIHQDTSSVPPMTTPVIDLTTSQSGTPLLTSSATTSTEILQQRMFEDNSYEAHEDYKKLYDALAKSLECDYSDQLLSNLEEARQKKRKRCDVPRTPFASPPLQPPPSPPPVGASGALNSLIPDDSIPDEQATTLASTCVTHAENSLLAKTRDMTNFLNWYCRQVNKTKLTEADLKRQAYEVVKAFYPDVIHLQFQMEECHKLLTDQVNWTNPEGDQVSLTGNRPLPLGGPPVHVTIKTQLFFNKDLEYLRYDSKGSSPHYRFQR
nr:hypothetical protein [Tanacetum cinerariifolium]